MTRTIHKLTSTLLATALAVVFVLSACLVSLAASTPRTVTLTISQKVTGSGNATDASGVYGLLSAESKNPLPVATNGKTKTRFEMVGSQNESVSFTFSEPGLYEYTLGKMKDATKTSFTKADFEAGTEEEPLTHVFGFKVVQNESGELDVIPYTCDDKKITLYNDGSGMTVENTIVTVADPGTTDSKGTDSDSKASTNASTTSRRGIPKSGSSSGSATNNGSGTKSSRVKGGKVNTGDESQLVLWIALLAVAGIGLLIVILAKRRRDDEEETK